MQTVDIPIHNDFYFAYGSNMNLSQMSIRCNDHQFNSIAVLLKYRFMINSRGKATIVPSQVDEVWGVLWTLSHDDITELDRWEGLSRGYYRREACNVVIQGDKKVKAWVYIASDNSNGSPSMEYSNLIIAGAKEHTLPEAYLKILSTVLG